MDPTKNVRLVGELVDTAAENGITRKIGRGAGEDFGGSRAFHALTDTHSRGCVGEV